VNFPINKKAGFPASLEEGSNPGVGKHGIRNLEKKPELHGLASLLA
jgi:hypothetical protein